jgi:hypothetical protein
LVGSNGFNEKYAMRTDILLCTYICIYVKTNKTLFCCRFFNQWNKNEWGTIVSSW